MVRLHDRVAAACLSELYGGYYPEGVPPPERLAVELHNPSFRSRRVRLERVCAPERRRILEIGCGDGNFLASLRGNGWAVEGTEFDEGSAGVARRRHGIGVRVADAADLGGAWPVVAAYHVLEHVYEPARWLSDVHGLLADDGILHLQVPSWGSLTRAVAGAAWTSLMFPQHVYFFTPSTLRALLQRSGFAVLSTTTWDPWHGPGTVSGSLANALRRPVPGAIPASPASGGRPAPGKPRPARRLLDAAAVPLARAEALLGRGAVVDVVARRVRGGVVHSGDGP